MHIDRSAHQLSAAQHDILAVRQKRRSTRHRKPQQLSTGQRSASVRPQIMNLAVRQTGGRRRHPIGCPEHPLLSADQKTGGPAEWIRCQQLSREAVRKNHCVIGRPDEIRSSTAGIDTGEVRQNGENVSSTQDARAQEVCCCRLAMR